MVSNVIIEVTEDSFQREVYANQGLVLIEFWTPACLLSQQNRALVDNIAQEYSYLIRFCRINIEVNQKLAQAFEIERTPTFLMLKNGEIVDELVGALSETALQTFIQNAI